MNSRKDQRQPNLYIVVIFTLYLFYERLFSKNIPIWFQIIRDLWKSWRNGRRIVRVHKHPYS